MRLARLLAEIRQCLEPGVGEEHDGGRGEHSREPVHRLLQPERGLHDRLVQRVGTVGGGTGRGNERCQVRTADEERTDRDDERDHGQFHYDQRVRHRGGLPDADDRDDGEHGDDEYRADVDGRLISDQFGR